MTVALALVEPQSPLAPKPAKKRRRSLATMTEHLNRASVKKSFFPMKEIPWEDPRYAVNADDPRFTMPNNMPLAQTDWYHSLDAKQQAALGLELLVQTLSYGVTFESVLSRGLLEFASALPNRSPLFRYAMHEVIEEGHHSMMFQEFIDRTGLSPDPLPFWDRALDPYVIRAGRTFPELFFVAVWGGEIFIDHDNRERLRSRKDLHPLVRDMLQIHVTEEARHLCFAESFLAESIPKLSWSRKARLALSVPVILEGTARLMLHPPKRIVREFGIPKAAIQQAYGRDSAHRAHVHRVIAPIRRLCEQNGMFRAHHRALWRLCGFDAAKPSSEAPLPQLTA